MQFQTSGNSFAPAAYLNGTPQTFLWTWSDGTTSSQYPIASKTFGTSRSRTQYLAVDPINVLTNFNIGYDASDWGETNDYTLRPQQNVSAVYFLQPLTGLQYWASSYNPIANTLDFTGFTSLKDIECYKCASLQHVVVKNLPSIRRICLEACNLQDLDVSGNPNMEELRAAVNHFTQISIGGGTGPKIWHWCVRDNPQITQDFQTIMTNFYSLREPWFWNCNQSGALKFVSTNLTDVELWSNSYGSADLGGQTNLQIFQIQNNLLTNVVLSGCSSLQYLELEGNFLSGPVLDSVLAALDASSPDLQYANLSSNAGVPSAAGYIHYQNLINRGVTVVQSWPAYTGPFVTLASTALLAEGCPPTNNAIDPGETVTMGFALKNTGSGNSATLTVTLLATNGVTAPSGPQSYGVLSAGGSAVSRSFTFTASGSCGGAITAVLQLSNGNVNLGTLSVPLILGASGTTVFSQNFDTVSVPALPSGWTTSATGGQSNWTTENATKDTAPNAAFSPDATSTGVNELVSPAVALPSGALQLSFANYYDLETRNDGAVLEIKIGANPFTDVLSAGGSFVLNGYNHTISTNFTNPLGGRQAWSGVSGGFVPTILNLPAAAAGQSVQFKWRCATDSGNGGTGWRIDSVALSTRACCGSGNNTNTPPILPSQTARTVAESTTLIVTNTATDFTTPPSGLSYVLQNPPAGAAIDTNGIITWTPTEPQAPSTNTITTIVTDNGAPPLSATNNFTVVVSEVNTAPSLPNQTNRTIIQSTTLIVTNRATDTDIPANVLNYVLQNPPAGATIDTNGIITWTPTAGQIPSTNTITTIVTDNGTPPLSATNSFTVVVKSSVIVVIDSTSLVAEGCTPTNNAIDPSETVTVLFAFKNTGIASTTNLIVTLLGTNGVTSPSGPQTYGALAGGGPPVSQPFTFSATGACGGTITANLSLQDGTANYGTATLSFPLGASATVLTQSFDSVAAPVLPAGWVSSATGFASNWVTEITNQDTLPNAAYCRDATNVGISELDSPVIALPTGSFQLSFMNYYDLEYNTVNTNVGFDGGVLEIKIGTNSFADILTAGGSFMSNGYNRIITNSFGNPLSNRPAWSGNTGGFTNTIVSLPASAGGQNIQLRWICGSDNGVARTGWRIDSISISGQSCCENTAPILPLQTNRTIAEMTSLLVINTASDPSAPPEILNYSLVNPPAGAQIDTNGVITWTPTEAQGPSTNTITTVVSDGGLSATNSFLVFVEPVPSIQSVAISNGVATITWTAMGGLKYRLQFKNDLRDTNWNDLLPDVLAAGPTATATNAVGGTMQRFYRVLFLP